MIFTFYSFKGGVGRSMALANVAELLYQRGLRVLMIDFDLEAPGLERFFEVPDAPSLAEVLEQRGVIDLVESYKDLRTLSAMSARQRAAASTDSGQTDDSLAAPAESPTPIDDTAPPPLPVEPLTKFVIPIRPGDSNGGALLLVPSGRRGGPELARYAERVRRFDWDDFYANWEGERFFDWFRTEAEQLADVVLVDSRTGITELTGVTTFHLPDVVVMFVAPNNQNLDGVRVMAKSLTADEVVSEGRRGRPLSLLFVPSRIDQSESESQAAFAVKFQRLLGEFMPPNVTFQNTPFVDLKVPYIGRYAYVEAVAARELDIPVAVDMAAAFQRLIAAMVDLSPKDGPLYKRFALPTEATDMSPRARAGIPPTEHFAGRTWVFAQVDKWLGESQPTTFLITGEPGSGKTALISRLLEMDSGIVDPAAERLGPGFIAAVHACNPFDSSTVDPLAFVEDLAEQLAARYPTFARALATIAGPQIKVDIKQTIGAATYGSQVTGISVGSVRLSGLSPVRAFQQAIREPLRALCEPNFTDTVLIVVDGVDAALSDSGSDSIVSLLAHAISGKWLPSQVRILATTRPDPRVVGELGGASIDLSQDPNTASDVVQYIDGRLADLHAEPDQAATLSRQLIAATDGNFLFAAHSIGQVRTLADLNVELAPLPGGLAGVYRTAIRVAAGSERWSDQDQRFLGVLTVALPPGLTLAEIARILLRPTLDVQKTAQRWTQFLESSDKKEERLRLYHRSFADFLLADADYGVDAGEGHRAIAEYFINEHEGGWGRADTYALTNGPRHLIEASRAAVDRAKGKELLERVTELLVDRPFTDAKARLIGTDRLMDDVSSALALADKFGDLSQAARSNLAQALVNVADYLRTRERTDQAPTRTIHGVLESDETVLIGAPFDLTVGISTASTPLPTTESASVIGDPAPYRIDVQLFADGFDIALGESWRQELVVTPASPFPSLTVHLTARDLLEPKAVRTITASFSVDGEPVGLAMRQLIVTTNPSVLSANRAQLTTTTTSIQAPTDRPADVTLFITRGLESGVLHWNVTSALRGVALPDDRPTVSSLGSDPRDFAYLVTRTLSTRTGDPGFSQVLTGIGVTIAGLVPRQVVSALQTANELVAPKPLDILLCTDEPSIPWELAALDEPFNRSAPNFLGAQANIGRWILDSSASRIPARTVQVSSIAVVWGNYTGSRLGRLVAAEEEADELQSRYGAISIDAQTEPVISLLNGSPATDIIHFAVHGTYDPGSPTQALFMVSGPPIEPPLVSGSDLTARAPFVFLNTAQVNSAQIALGDNGGLAQAFLRAGASGVLVAIWPISDMDAKQIALDFYSTVSGSAGAPSDGSGADGEGAAVADVLRQARARLSEHDDGPAGSYLAYQFYGHPSLRLSWKPTHSDAPGDIR